MVVTDKTSLDTLRNKFSIDNRTLDRHSHRVEHILQEVNSKDRVLDVGCVAHSADMAQSDLWLHGQLADKASSVIGIDIDPQEVATLQQQGYDVREADAEQFSFDRSFDVIVAGELIEHLSNPGSFLESARKNLSSNGKLVLSTPNPWTLDRTMAAILAGGMSPNPDHTCWYDRYTIATLLRKNGFVLKELTYLPPPRPTLEPSFRFVRNTLLSFVHKATFESLGGPEMIVVAHKES